MQRFGQHFQVEALLTPQVENKKIINSEKKNQINFFRLSNWKCLYFRGTQIFERKMGQAGKIRNSNIIVDMLCVCVNYVHGEK